MELGKADCTGGYYPADTATSTSAIGQTTNFNFLRTYLVAQSYLSSSNSTLNDPSSPTYVYNAQTANNSAAAVCAGGSNGSNTFYISARMENANDPQMQPSWSRCSGVPGVPGTFDNRYYVCPD